MNMPSKKVLASTTLLLGLVGGGVLEAYRQTQLPPQTFVTSPMGGYRLENVRVDGPFFLFSNLAYLRIVDTTDPKRVYRSPLYNLESVDMSQFEDEKEVGIRWITLRKKEQDFTLGVPQWRECWQNLFISNTPYTVYPNG